MIIKYFAGILNYARLPFVKTVMLQRFTRNESIKNDTEEEKKMRRRVMSMGLAVVIALNALVMFNVYVMSGNGTELNPYVITNTEELQDIQNSLGDYYKLGNDIDLQSVSWTPIDGFTGTLDGNGKTIQGLSSFTYSDSIGLFKNTAGATFKNIQMENCDLSGNVYSSGALVVYMDGGLVENCHIKSSNFLDDMSWETSFGGLIGFAEGVTITYCSAVDVSGFGEYYGFGYMGGLVGKLVDSTISKCWFSGSLISYSELATGGIIGYASNVTMNECYVNADLEIRWGAPCGALIGGSEEGGLDIWDSFSLCGADIPMQNETQMFSASSGQLEDDSLSQLLSQIAFFDSLITNAANLNLAPEIIQKIQDFYESKKQSLTGISLMSVIDETCGMVGWDNSWNSSIDKCYSLCHPFTAF